MLDINLFGEGKGGNPEITRESQRLRSASVEIVDEIIHIDKERRQRQFELEQLRKDFNRINEEVVKLRITGGDVSSLIKTSEENKDLTARKQAEVQKSQTTLYSKLETLGSLVHDSVPVSSDEEPNAALPKATEVAAIETFKPKLDNVFVRKLLSVWDTPRDQNGGSLSTQTTSSIPQELDTQVINALTELVDNNLLTLDDVCEAEVYLLESKYATAVFLKQKDLVKRSAMIRAANENRAEKNRKREKKKKKKKRRYD